MDLNILTLKRKLDTRRGDLVIGKNHKSAIGSIVERKTRLPLIIQLKSKNGMELANQFSQILNKLNSIYKKP